MKLHRIVTLTFPSKPSADKHSAPAEPSTQATLGAVTIHTSPTTSNGKTNHRVLAIAEIDLPNGITIDSENYVAVPEAERKACEHAIEAFANMTAVFRRGGRTVSSATPYIALSQLTPDEELQLDASLGFRGPRTIVAAGTQLDFSDPHLVNALSDRLIGATLLAEVLSTNHAVGQYRELARFLEHAFARPLTQLSKKLSQFLAPANLGYTRAEVDTWIAPRHPAIHGDEQAPEDLVLERDVRHLLARMEQAAYDILFNKLQWHDPSHLRRDAFRHLSATTDASSALKITRGEGATLTAQVLDEFGAYPVDLAAAMTNPPAEWWRKAANKAPRPT